MEFSILLLCPKFLYTMLFSYRLLQNVSDFLIMERLGYFVTRIIFLSMGESFLIFSELVFLNSNPSWRRFAVEQLNLPYTFVTDSPPVDSRYDITVIIVGYHHFWYRFCERKKILPSIFYRHMQRAKWNGLFVVCKYLFGFFLWFDGVSVMVPEFLSRIDVCHVFAEVKLFFNIDFTWYSEFITPPNTSNYLWCVSHYCFFPAAMQSV